MRLFLLFILAGWLLGIAVGSWHFSAAWIAGTITALIVLVRGNQQPWPLIAAVCGVHAIGFLYGLPQGSLTQAACNTRSLADSNPATVTVQSMPRHRLQSSQYEVRSDNNCAILLSAPRFPEYGLGDILELTGTSPQPVQELAQENPGYAGYLARRGLHAIWSYPAIQVVQRHARPARLYDTVDEKISKLFREPDASMVRALLLADDGELPDELKNNFRATGLTHILAISGMNISLWASMLIVMLQPVPLPPLARTILISSVLWAYMALINWPISAVRATFFWTVALLAFRLHALVSLPSVLLVTLVGMLSFQPLLVQDVGFQLSVSAVGGIFLLLFVTKKVFSRQAAWLKIVFGTLAVTAGATLATWPIIAYHFGTISFSSLLANMLVAPAVELQMAAVALTLILGSVSDALALFPSLLTHFTVMWMAAVSAHLGHIAPLYWQDVHIAGWMLVIYYACVIAASHLLIKWQRRSWREVWE